MLKLICGPSGSSKTSLLTSMIRTDIENGTKCFLLVPEQQAYISELDIPKKLPQNAWLFFDIVNFSRLAEDIFKKYGGVTVESLNTGIRSLLMWDTLRTLSPMLTQYGKSARADLTLTAMMLQTIDELKMADISSLALDEASASLSEHPALQKKLSDLAMVSEMFSQKNKEAFGTDPSDKLLRMADKLRNIAF